MNYYVLEREQDRDVEFSTELVHNISLRVPNGIDYVIVLEVKKDYQMKIRLTKIKI